MQVDSSSKRSDFFFQVVVNDYCNKRIDIDTVNHGDKSVERMKTPEIVEKDVKEYKQNQKKKYFEQAEKGTIIMKDNSSDILLNHHTNQLFYTKQHSIYNNLHQTNAVLMTGCTEQQADELIQELCPRFVEFVVVLGDY